MLLNKSVKYFYRFIEKVAIYCKIVVDFNLYGY